MLLLITRPREFKRRVIIVINRGELYNPPENVSFANARYAVVYTQSPNLGDDIQTLAAIELLKKRNITDFEYVDRSNFADYKGPPVKLIMNGWFRSDLPTSANIKPIFISYHCGKPNSFFHYYRRFFKYHEPIGCRDLYTADQLRSVGVQSYFSGCLTLTFDETSEKSENVYLTDVNNQKVSYIPKIDTDLSTFASAEEITHELYRRDKTRNDIKTRMKLANQLLDKYRAAKLVVTSRLHCALPCRAFNTDVVFIHRNYASDSRFRGLEKYLNGYDGGQPGSSLDLSKKRVERATIDKRKQMLIEQFNRLIDAA